MAERRYGFRFSLLEGAVLVMSLLLASFLVFLFGVYVGREVEAQRTVQQARTVRLPVTVAEDTPPTRASTSPASQVWQVPKVKSLAAPPSPHLTFPPQQAGNPAPNLPPPAAPSPTAIAVLPSNPTPPTPAPPAVPSSSPPTSSLPLPPLSVPPPGNQTGATPSLASTVPTERQQNPPSAPSQQSTVIAPAQDLPGANAPIAATAKPPERMKYWRVQVEATTDEEAARGLAKALREQGHATSVSRIVKDGQAWYRVRVGKYEAQEDAVAAIARFRRDGHFSQAYLVQE